VTAAVPADRDLLAVPYTRTADLADEVLGYTDAVVVLDPPELRDEVVRRLREAVAMARRLAGADREEADRG